MFILLVYVARALSVNASVGLADGIPRWRFRLPGYLTEKKIAWRGKIKKKTGGIYEYVRNNSTCSVMFQCKDGDRVKLVDLCTGLSDCVEESRTCAAGRGSASNLLTSSKSFAFQGSRQNRLLYCVGIKNLEQMSSPCVHMDFYPLQRNVYGEKALRINLPNRNDVGCDYVYGQPYVYLSCLRKCPDSQCPLISQI